MQVWQPGIEQRALLLSSSRNIFVCEGDRKLASYCNQEIWVLKLRKLISQTQVSFLVVKTAKYKRGTRNQMFFLQKHI